MTSVSSDGKRKRVFIRTYGCQMNVYDSDRMADVLRPLGYALSESPEQADLVVVNTCHIREHASEKVYSELGRLRDEKQLRRAEGRDLTIAVAGCVAQAEGEEIVKRQPAVDIVVGPQAYHRLPELLAEAERKAAIRRAGKRLPGAGVLDTEFPAESKFDHLPQPQGVRGGSAFLSIQEGCDKFCTFCVVPYTRGAEYSRPPSAVLAEARQLVANGAIDTANSIAPLLGSVKITLTAPGSIATIYNVPIQYDSNDPSKGTFSQDVVPPSLNFLGNYTVAVSYNDGGNPDKFVLDPVAAPVTVARSVTRLPSVAVAAAPSKHGTSRERILIVDDEPDTCANLSDILTDVGDVDLQRFLRGCRRRHRRRRRAAKNPDLGDDRDPARHFRHRKDRQRRRRFRRPA